jgi:putative MATE family efflux protein
MTDKAPDEHPRAARGRHEATLTQGGIASTLIRLTGPMLVGMLAMVGFNVVDTFFIGRLGTLELAAISFTFPVVLVVSSLSVGIGIGAASAVAKAIGRGDSERVKRLTTDSVTLSFAIVVFVAAIGLLTIDPLFRALGASEEILPLIRQYMIPWYIGTPVVVIPMVGNSAIRATGDTKTPAAIMLVAMAVNVVLDPLLIFGPGPFPALGLQGAALATVGARAAALVASVWVLARREHMLTTARPTVREGLRSWGEVVHVGLPAGLTNLIVPVSMGVITRLVAEYGVPAVAGLGVATRLEMVPIMTINALGSVLVPFVGQNWGAGKPDRVLGAMRMSYLFSLALGAVTFLIAVVAAEPIAGLFDDDPAVISTVVLYLLIISSSYGPQGVLLLSTSGFNALSKPLPAVVLSLLRMVVLWVPLAYLGSELFGLAGIFWAGFFANILGGTAAWIWFTRRLTRLSRQVWGVDPSTSAA